MRKAISLAISILAALVISSASLAHAHTKHLQYGRVTGRFTYGTILTRSKMREVTVLTFRIDKKPPTEIKALPIIINSGNVTERVLFVRAETVSAGVHSVNWHVDSRLRKYGIGILVISGDNVTVGTTLKIEILRQIQQPDGFYVGDKVGTEPRYGLSHFAGCFKIATGIPYAMDHNNGVSVTVMKDPGKGFHGWCYKNRNLKNKFKYAKYYLHYFAVSTAKSWKDVATWMRQEFTDVEHVPSVHLEHISKSIGLGRKNVTARQKIAMIRKWMHANLRYSGDDTFPRKPTPFDEVVKNKFGDCKALSLVMVELLRAAHIDAHIVVTSTKDPSPFVQNSSNVNALNHVAVYVPLTKQYFDPTAGTGAGLAGQQVMDIETGAIMTVPENGK